MTQAEAAQEAGVSLPTLKSIEGGKSEPQVRTLLELSRAFRVSVQDLVRPLPELQRVRFRSTKRMRCRQQVLVEVERWLQDFRLLEDVLKQRVACAFSGLLPELKRYPGVRRARKAAELARVRAGLSPDEAIRDICGLLEAHGVKVFPFSLESDAFFGLSVNDEKYGPAVVVNTWDRIATERQIFSAAHELGHLILHLDAFDVERQDEDPEQEKEANVFASHFLMPEEAFEREWENARGQSFEIRVLKIKRIFKLSYKTVLYRLIESGRADASVWKQFQQSYSRRFGRRLAYRDEPEPVDRSDFAPEWRKSGEPSNLEAVDFVENRLSRLVRTALEKEEISLSRAAEMMRLSLVEMRGLASLWVRAA